jgi:hypothetical protein
MRTYWIIYPRGFMNEYDVGIATTEAHARQYSAEGYVRITRERALRQMSWGGDNATTVDKSVSINGEQGPPYPEEVARSLRATGTIAGMRVL